MQKIIIETPTFRIEIDADNERDLIKQAAFWQSIPAFCPICKAPLILNYRRPQTFEYYEVKCTGIPSHSVNFGEAKGTHNLYFDAKKQWKTFSPNAIDQADEPVWVHPPATTPTPALSAPTANGSGEKANIGGLKNQLIKLIQQSKDSGFRTGLLPADVAGMNEKYLLENIAGLTAILEKGPPANV
jgi:hypothetical protein